MDCDSFILSIRAQKIINDSQCSEDLFYFSNLIKIHELLSKKIIKVVGIFKSETAKNNSIDEFLCVGSKTYTFKGNDENIIKLKGISKPQ